MERRELLKMIALLTGGVMIGGNALLVGCNPEKRNEAIAFSVEDQKFLDEVADTILPATKSPGAKAAKTGSFMTLMINDCYEEKDQKIFHKGIDKLNDACEKMHNVGFIKATAEQRHLLLVALDKEAKEYKSEKNEKDEIERQKNKEYEGQPNHYFTMMKQLTLLGYFTSEPGCTEALRYIAVPGRYEGSVPYKKGDRAWT